jgi:WD40 repeat protein
MKLFYRIEFLFVKRVFLLSFFLLFWMISFSQTPRLLVPIGHTNYIMNVAYSRDGKLVVTSSDDKTAKIWRAADGKLLVDLKDHNSYVGAAVFDPEAKTVVTGASDGIIRTWEIETGLLIKEWKAHRDGISDLSFSPDGKNILSTSHDGMVKIWDASTGVIVREFEAHQRYVNSARYSKDGKKIVTASDDNKAKIWDAITDSLLFTLQEGTGAITHAEFSPDGKMVVTSCNDAITRIWDATNGKIIRQLSGHKSYVNYASFSPDGETILTTSWDNTMKLWRVIDGTVIRIWDNEISGRLAIFSPDGKYILSTTGFNTVIFNTGTAKTVNYLRGYTSRFEACLYNKNIVYGAEGNFASAQSNGHVKIWDTRYAKLLGDADNNGNGIRAIDYSPDGKLIATGDFYGNIKIFDAGSQKLLVSMEEETRIEKEEGYVNRTHLVNSVQFSPDGETLLTASSDGFVKLWRVSDGQLLKEIEHLDFFTPDCDVISAHFIIEGSYIQTYSKYGLSSFFKIWDLEGKLLKREAWSVRRPDEIYMHPDDQNCLLLFEDTAAIWQPGNDSILTKITGHKGKMISAAYSPVCDADQAGGRYIATGSEDKTARIWNAKDGSLRLTLSGHTGPVTKVAFSADGTQLVTSSDDNTSKLWDVETGRLLYTFFAMDSTDYFTLSPSGYYMCTPNAARLLHYVKGLQVYNFDQLDIRYNRPDKVLEEMGNTDTTLIEAYTRAYLKRIKKLGIDTASFRDGTSIPDADFMNREQIPFDFKSPQIKLQIKGADSVLLLDRFNIWVNDVPVFGMKGISIKWRKSKSFDTTVTITLSSGDNRIETSVTNVNGTESYRKPLLVNYSAPKKMERVYFIGIGIDHFANSNYNLTWSSKDIRDMAAALRTRFGDSLVITDTLFNQRVNIQNIRALRKKLDSAGVDDKVIIAYSGHGLLNKSYDYFLSSYNINFDDPDKDGIPYEELEQLLDGIKPRKKLLLIDACHSGEVDKEDVKVIDEGSTALNKKNVNATKGSQIIENENNGHLGLKSSFDLMQELFNAVGKGTGATIISAAGGYQFAYEKSNLANGVFTYSFLNLLKNEPEMNVSELKDKVSSQVEQLTNGMQKPTSRSATNLADWRVW